MKKDLHNLIISHFGNRAFLIKLNTSLRQIATARFQERQSLQGIPLQILEDVAGKFEALEAQEHSFQELQVLRSYYEHKLNFDADEAKQLLQVTGEYGISCGDRLGLNERATIAEMIPIAEKQMQYWYQLANDTISFDSQTREAAQVMARSYESILYHITEAKKHLYL